LRRLSGHKPRFSDSERGLDPFADPVFEPFEPASEHRNIASGGQIRAEGIACETERREGDPFWGNRPAHEVLVIDPAEGEFVVLFVRPPLVDGECIEPSGGGFVLAVELVGPWVHGQWYAPCA